MPVISVSAGSPSAFLCGRLLASCVIQECLNLDDAMVSHCFVCSNAPERHAVHAEMSQTELVAMLRSRARKSGTQTSHFRGVSLLKQTGKWHAQINVGGKQVIAGDPDEKL